MRVLAYLLMVLALLTLAPWAMMAMMSPMLFDSGESSPLWAVFAAVWLYPVWLLAFLIWAFFSARAGRLARAIWLTVLAVAPALVLLGYLGLSSVIKL